jgi:hypothetical protein
MLFKFNSIHSFTLISFFLIGCSGYYGQAPREYVQRSVKLQEFKNKVFCDKGINQLLKLSYAKGFLIAIEPDVEYDGLENSDYKGSKLILRLKTHSTERVFIALGLNKKLDDKKQKYNLRSDYLEKIKANIVCYFISDGVGYSIYRSSKQLIETLDGEVLK